MNKIIFLPLRSSVLCIECNTLSNATGDSCPACGSSPLVCLGRLLNRKPVESVTVELEVAHA